VGRRYGAACSSLSPCSSGRETESVRRHLAGLDELPLVLRCVVVGAFSLGIVGAICGLIVGLVVHVATAPFAMIELGLPSAIVGCAIGASTGLVLKLTHRVMGKRP